jgi:hypothetical protein
MVNDVTSIASCTNYTAAVIETKELYDSRRPAHSRGRFCFNGDMAPDSITWAAIVLKYLRYNPDKLNWSAPPLVINAILGEFRCKESPKK